jgi:SAM-dependent methyltransferase
MGELLEHVRDGVGLLAEVVRVLVAGGRLLLSTPDHGPLLRFRLGVDRAAFERHFEPRADHLRFYTRRSLSAQLRDAGVGELAVRSRHGVLLASGSTAA